MSDQNTDDVNDPAVRRALDAWAPMAPPADFADRVLSARTLAPQVSPAKRAWWLAAPIAAVAMIALVLFFASSAKKEATSPAANGASYEQAAGNNATTDLLAPGVSVGSGSSMGMAGSGMVAMNQPVADAGIATRPIADDAETDIAVIAGTSVTIHDPSGSTMLHIDFAAVCSTGADVIVLGSRNVEIARASGLTRAVVTVATGSWSYEVRCESTPSMVAAKGWIAVQRDKANRKLLKVTRAVNTIEPDGRAWRVSYHYVQPDIRVKAPGATHVQLVANGVETRVAVIGGIAKLPALAEGTYTYRALAPSGPGKVSTLTIDFDNTAPQIYLGTLRSAANGAMLLDGEVAPGWTLSIGGAPITVDKNLRFQATARGFSRIVIRAEHPTRGVHYFATLPITR